VKEQRNQKINQIRPQKMEKDLLRSLQQLLRLIRREQQCVKKFQTLNTKNNGVQFYSPSLFNGQMDDIESLMKCFVAAEGKDEGSSFSTLLCC
jgi:hypothetical protein